MQPHSNPKMYRELSQPFADDEAAGRSLDAFYDAVQDARKLYRIPDVSVVVAMNVTDGDGEHSVYGRLHLGDRMRALPMIAYALGREEAEAAQIITSMRSQGKKP